MALADLAKVDIRVSGVLAVDLETAWPVVRRFSAMPFLRTYGRDSVSCSLLPGYVDHQIGTVRCVSIGPHKLVEQLTALDDTHHYMSYGLISHPSNSNPFIGSFVNYTAKVKLLSVTMNDETFCELEATFYTDHDQVQAMHGVIENLSLLWMQGLNTYLCTPQPQIGSVPIGSAPIGHTAAAPTLGRISVQQPHQQQPLLPNKAGAELYGKQYGGPDSGDSAKGETVSALHAPLQQRDSFGAQHNHSHMHPNTNFAQQPQQQQQQQQSALTSYAMPSQQAKLLRRQQEQLYQQRQLQQQQQDQLQMQQQQQQQHLQQQQFLQQQHTMQAAGGPGDALYASDQPVATSPIRNISDQSQFYPQATGVSPPPMSTPFATAPLLTEGTPATPPISPHQPHALPPKSQTSLDSAAGGRSARRLVSEMLNSGSGGRTQYYGGEPGTGSMSAGPHTAIRDLHSSGASTIGPGAGMAVLLPVGSADSLGTSPGGATGERQGEDYGSGFNSRDNPSMWPSQRTDSGRMPTSR